MNIDFIPSFLSGPLKFGYLNFAKGLKKIVDIIKNSINPSEENIPQEPEPISDEEIKEESIGNGKTPDETGEDEKGDKTNSNGKWGPGDTIIIMKHFGSNFKIYNDTNKLDKWHRKRWKGSGFDENTNWHPGVEPDTIILK